MHSIEATRFTVPGILPSRPGIHQPGQFFGTHRLRQVMIETCFSGADAISWQTISGDRYECHMVTVCRCAQLPCDLITIHVGQTNVQQDDIWLEVRNRSDA
ncbi:hypothetical protein LMG29542_07218 [Paraburkholderia humisilvae]|uniref:Uncharacterized protein n=1 Tax=Paraburkholderia humisilvae TaxID=627669 RepID=A0A6J5F6J2_9BURK|nr:hypothetical protein LMG29542_07218 [Paraburkholderia humisilvae]